MPLSQYLVTRPPQHTCASPGRPHSQSLPLCWCCKHSIMNMIQLSLLSVDEKLSPEGTGSSPQAPSGHGESGIWTQAGWLCSQAPHCSCPSKNVWLCKTTLNHLLSPLMRPVLPLHGSHLPVIVRTYLLESHNLDS